MSRGNDNEVYLRNGSTTIQITDNQRSDLNPDISGSNVVWEPYRPYVYGVVAWPPLAPVLW